MGAVGPANIQGHCSVRRARPTSARSPGLRITKVMTPPFENDCYLLRCTATGDTLLVDAAGDAPLARCRGRPARGRRRDARPLGPPAGARGRRRGRRSRRYRPRRRRRDLPVPVTAPCRRRRRRPGRPACRRGHRSRGAHARLDRAAVRRRPERPHLWTGDSLFPGGAGNTEKDAARFTRLMDDLERKVFGAAPGRDLGLPGPRRGHDAGRGAAVPAGWRERGW